MDFIESTLQWVDKMLLCDMIRLRDVPKEIRTSSGSIYVTALRISNSVSGERFIQDLKILMQDIYTMPDNNSMKGWLIGLLQDYLNVNDHKGEDIFESFREDMYPEVVQALQDRTDTVKTMFRNFQRQSENAE